MARGRADSGMAFNRFEESIMNTPFHVPLNGMARPLAVGALLAVGGEVPSALAAAIAP